MARLSSSKKKWKKVTREADDLGEDSIVSTLHVDNGTGDCDKSCKGLKNKVFLFHNAPSQYKLYLSLSNNSDDFYFDAWISVNRLPVNLFICKTLEFLKLTYLVVIIYGSFFVFRDFIPLFLQMFMFVQYFNPLSLLSSIERYIPTLLVSSPSLKRLDVSLVNDYDHCELEEFEINAISLEYLHVSNFFVRGITPQVCAVND
ncbi:hypothetical protein M9H77_23960 [Catharanthus roseus]|uniref:Uncharacterized protein n=1 Tax=Catharanthus roseus TaxID=4058 RepID=A0ACC0AXA6_CATRO|nr:hypothetical protein M9H77_23960 [Catharanthus roseus]